MENRNYTTFDVALAVIVLLFIALMAPSPAGAQSPDSCAVQPDGSVLCCDVQPDGSELCTSSISSTLTPFVPTSTPVPTATLSPIPTPTATLSIQPWKRFVYMPIGMTP